MIVQLSAQARGSSSLVSVPPDIALSNGDFLIKSPAGGRVAATGDGSNEATFWDFDFKEDLNWSHLSLEQTNLISAKLILGILPKNPAITTDVVKINVAGFTRIESPQIQNLELNKEALVELDLLADYPAHKIKEVLADNNGQVPMTYSDDAIIFQADLILGFEVASGDCKLCVQAISEDTIAAPGNKRPNYLIASVTDPCGHPISDLDASNFEVDALIVGPGGSLVEITRVREASRLEGFYFIDLKPVRSRDWKSGVYIFGLVVKAGDRVGQSLASVLMD